MDEGRIRVLIAEGDSAGDGGLDLFLEERGFEVTRRADGRAALDSLRSATFDVALLDVAMLGAALRDGGALEALRAARGDQAPCEVVLIFDGGTPNVALDGEYDQIARPYRLAAIEALARRAWRRRQLVMENVLLRTMLSRSERPAEIVTHYAPMRAVMELAGRVARGDSAVLIAGERGTGKSLLARALHARSRRADGIFVEVDCAAVPGDELESQLFGREYTAASGASSRQLGLLELATNGTICIDRIDALGPALQAKLLHALELGTFYRTGGTQKAYGAPRVVATTAFDLAPMVSNGSIRGDLYYRINAVSVALPPLRERTVDILPLARHFLSDSRMSPAPELGVDAISVLEGYAWPGNVAELREVILRAATRATDGIIHASHLPLGAAAVAPAPRPESGGERGVALDQVERDHIEAVLAQEGWHQGRAAEVLGISPKTLYRKIRQYGFQRPASRERNAG